MFHRLTLVVLLLAILASGMAAGTWWWLNRTLDKPLVFEGPYFPLQVENGDTLSGIARQLAGKGLVSSPVPILAYAHITGNTAIRAGEYRVPRGETARQFLGRLIRGDVVQYRITFPEGTTLKEWLDIIAGNDKLGAKKVDLARLRHILGLAPDAPLEGWFFPDTYVFTASDTPVTILEQAYRRMHRVLNDEWRRRRGGLPFDNPYQALILASIVEKETGLPKERSKVAGVFVRRLQKGMRLQTDPTVIYGLGAAYQGNLKRKHLEEENPYNTYRIKGLPPTPIANPGRPSIHAVMNPAGGDALYFVARGDGSHYFSATLAEHRRAVRRFQLERRQNYRSAPQPDAK